MAGHDGYRAEFPHRASVTKNDPVNQTPFHRWQRDVPKSFPSARAERQCRLLLLRARGLHHRNQFPRDKRKRDKHRRQYYARNRKDNFDVNDFAEEMKWMVLQPRAKK